MKATTITALHGSLAQALSEAASWFLGGGRHGHSFREPAVVYAQGHFSFGERRDGKLVLCEEDLRGLFETYPAVRVQASVVTALQLVNVVMPYAADCIDHPVPERLELN